MPRGGRSKKERVRRERAREQSELAQLQAIAARHAADTTPIGRPMVPRPKREPRSAGRDAAAAEQALAELPVASFDGRMEADEKFSTTMINAGKLIVAAADEIETDGLVMFKLLLTGDGRAMDWASRHGCSEEEIAELLRGAKEDEVGPLRWLLHGQMSAHVDALHLHPQHVIDAGAVLLDCVLSEIAGCAEHGRHERAAWLVDWTEAMEREHLRACAALFGELEELLGHHDTMPDPEEKAYHELLLRMLPDLRTPIR